MLGNNTLSLLDKAKNLSLKSEQTIKEFVEAIGESLEDDLISKVRMSPYFSISILEECTDISVLKQLALVTDS